jgi:hypothetical protein
MADVENNVNDIINDLELLRRISSPPLRPEGPFEKQPGV